MSSLARPWSSSIVVSLPSTLTILARALSASITWLPSRKSMGTSPSAGADIHWRSCSGETAPPIRNSGVGRRWCHASANAITAAGTQAAARIFRPRTACRCGRRATRCAIPARTAARSSCLERRSWSSATSRPRSSNKLMGETFLPRVACGEPDTCSPCAQISLPRAAGGASR